MKRWLVIFTSQDLDGQCDETFVSVHAKSPLEGIQRARLEGIPHPWATVRAMAWPRGARTVEHAIKRAVNESR